MPVHFLRIGFQCVFTQINQLPLPRIWPERSDKIFKQYFSHTLFDRCKCVLLDVEISLAASRKIKLKLLADEGK